MKIILLNRHEAVAIDDESRSVTVEPSITGILTVNGVDYPIQDGVTAPVLEDRTKPKAAFTTVDGITFTILSPRIYKGVLTTRLDPYTYAIESRLHIDRLEKELEKTREELRQFRGSVTFDALKGIIL